jgi:endonuclease G
MQLTTRPTSIKTKLFPILTTIAVLLAALALPVHGQSVHLKMGNPSQAKADTSQKDNFLMEKDFFALSYNNSKGTPNWVSWRLVKTDLGNSPRFPFHPDEDLPPGFNQITPKDYTGGGFDRGHMCPHSDRSADDDMSEATFVMSNMIPQSPNVNQKAWAQLEMYCRNLVENQNKTLYIIDGPAGQDGVGRNGPKQTVGKVHKVVVPAKCWKVIIVVDAGHGDDLKKVNDNTRLIAVIMPNDMSVGEEWAGFRVSVKDVETLTGYKFFDKVPDTVIEPLKEVVDDEPISHATAIRHGSGE